MFWVIIVFAVLVAKDQYTAVVSRFLSSYQEDKEHDHLTLSILAPLFVL